MPYSVSGSSSGSSQITQAVSVDLVSSGNVTLSGEQTIDGVLTSSSLVLCVGQTDASENGIYTTGSASWSRASSLNSQADLDEWIARRIEAHVGTGGTYYGQGRQIRFRLSNSPAKLGTNDLEWAVAPGLYRLYSNTLGNSTTAQIDVADIPAIQGANIRIQITGSSAKTSAGSSVGSIYVGGSSSVDTTASNYYLLNEYIYGSGLEARETLNTGPYIAFPAQNSARAGSCVINIADYSLPDYHTHIYGNQNAHHNTSQSGSPIWQAFTGMHAVWEDASIVERVRIAMADALTAGTRIVISVEVQP